MSSIIWIILIACAAATGMGLALLRRGFKGYATDDHPVCGACGFDLFGLPSTAINCSECGADVTTPGSTRIGNRRRRPKLILAGAMLLLPVTVVAIIVVGATVANVQWIQYEPLWILRRQAMSSTATPAAAEILRRVQGGALSDAQVQSLTDQVLLIQADAKQTWNTQWGDWVEAARANKKVPDEKWKSYLANAIVVKLVARSEIRRGEGLPIRAERPGSRVGAQSRFWMETHREYEKDSVVQARISGAIGNGGAVTATGGGASTQIVPLDAKRVAAVSDGPQTLKVRLKVKIYDGPMPTKVPTATRDIDIEVPWRLVPADQPTVKPIHDPSLRPAVEKSIRDVRVRMSNNFQQDYIDVNAQFDNPPAPLAYKIILRSGQQEWPVGSMYVLGKTSMGWGTGGDGKGITADRVDVIFRPDESVAASTVDLHEYWDGEVVVKDVKIDRPKPPTTPASVSPTSTPAR
jgi:hypothetical protein